MWPFKPSVNDLYEKLNPAQSTIVDEQGESHSGSYKTITHKKSFKKIEAVNRGISLIANLSAEIKIDIGDKLPFNGKVTKVRPKKISTLLNFRPNEYQGANEFNTQVYLDLLIEGNAFIYWDGAYLYHLPAENVEVISDRKTFVKAYRYGTSITYQPNEIIHIKDNNPDSIFRGSSRLESSTATINLLNKMVVFQDTFFKNGAIPGLILKSPHVLSKKIKDRIVLEWQQRFSPNNGSRRPVVLDGELELDSVNREKFSELDFTEGVKSNEEKILEAIGVPPILIKGGNNANIAPNLKLMYITTILPLIKKVASGYELFFGYDIKHVLQDVLALSPELKDQASFLTSLKNAGIISANEARLDLRKEEKPGKDDLIDPANVAGSAVNPSIGGAPKKPKDEDNKGEK